MPVKATTNATVVIRNRTGLPQRQADASPPRASRAARLGLTCPAVAFSGLLPYILWPTLLIGLLLLRGTLVEMAEGGKARAVHVEPSSQGGRPVGATPAVTTAAKAAQRQQPAAVQHCQNTCFKANDGVCDEGRPRSGGADANGNSTSSSGGSGDSASQGVEGKPDISQLLCDLGTDCNDCGPWSGTVPSKWDEHDGPVAWARARNLTLYSRPTETPLPFLAAITHHSVDPDVSAMLWHYRAMEGGITRILHHALKGACGPVDGRRRVVLDVGANFGYYTVQAAKYGCRVVAFEPVRKFRAYLEWALHANGVAWLVDVVPHALGDSGGSAPVSMVLPKDGSYWGLASVNGVNVLKHEASETITVPSTSLDAWEEWAPKDLEPTDLLLLKMDLEGWEGQVLRGGMKLLQQHVEHVLMEYSPGVWERYARKDIATQRLLPSGLLALASAGFRMAHLPLFAFAAPWPPRAINPQEPLPAFEEVTPAMARHDLASLDFRERMEVDPGGCPMPPELKRWSVWSACREWAYAAHPKGFRPIFGFNTNIWATRRGALDSGLMKLNGTAALFDEGQDMKVWTSQSKPGVSMAGIKCSDVGPGHLVLFHCPCPADAPKECTEQEAVVTRLAQEGRMPFTGPDGGWVTGTAAGGNSSASASAGTGAQGTGTGTGAQGVGAGAQGAGAKAGDGVEGDEEDEGEDTKPEDEVITVVQQQK